MKKLFCLLTILPFVLCSCGEGNAQTQEVYLKPDFSIGENESNNFMVTMRNIEKSSVKYSDDQNKIDIVITYEIKSNFDKVLALGSIYNYSAVFDDKKQNGNLIIPLLNYQLPSESIAPGQKLEIKLIASCFTDWRKVRIAYQNPYEKDINYSFTTLSQYYFPQGSMIVS